MKCLITGASSGIGRDISRKLSNMGHEVILVSSDLNKLNEVSKSIINSKVYKCDLKNENEIDDLLKFIEKEKPEIVINNAGFGLFGFYDEVDIKKEIDMIKVNILALQKITSTCLKYMSSLSESYILNVSSIAGLMVGGPLMSTYYASKSYVRSYTLAIYKELKKKNVRTNISLLCPGPVNTNFNNRADVEFSLKSLSSEYVSDYAINMMFKKKKLIIPGFMNKITYYFSKIMPINFMLNLIYNSQRRKRNN